MNTKKQLLALVGLMVGMITGINASYADNEWRYGLSYINNFSSCDSACQESQLRYAGDQINQLDTQLNSAGLSKSFKYANTFAQSTDIIEDYHNGYDNYYADNVEFYAITTHGGITTTLSGQNVYYAVYCSSGNSNYSSGFYSNGAPNNCIAPSNKMFFHEKNNSFNNTYSTNKGYLRWLILSTCNSINANPMEYWSGRFTFGLDYLLGYKNNLKIGETTDECLADFASHAFGGTSKFKQVWFSGNDDWWEDNTAGVFTCGTPGYPTQQDSEDRRDNYTKTWAERLVFISATYYCSWSWHQG